MRKLIVGFVLFTLSPSINARNRKHIPDPPALRGLIIGRRTYFDFGPPFDFYEVFSIQPAESGLFVERLTLTPAGHPCTQPATVEIASATISESLADLLGSRNPCSIPEKALRRELSRRKKCLTFSGADVTMQAECGDQTRQIQMDILDRDMFDPAPRTPEHTSWTMGVLERLDQALGPGVMDRPAFASEPAPTIVPAALSSHVKTLNALGQGAFDSLFKNTPDKVSAIYSQSQRPRVVPTVEMMGSPSFQPISYALPSYPPVARFAHIEGKVAFRVNVTSEGKVANLSFVTGHIMLQKPIESEVAKWRFPPQGAGQTVEFVFEFRTNCPSARQR